MHIKERLDKILLEKGLVDSINMARAYIMEGKVKVKAAVICKPGYQVSPADNIVLTLPKISFVSRGGIKLHGAIEAFGIDVRAKTAMDVGSSTGGFTDCLIQHGAGKVYAIDVGRGLMDYKLRHDKRIVLMEGINFRYFDSSSLLSAIDIAAIDVSFISLALILPKVLPCLKEKAAALALIKPQFELDKKDVDKGGVIRSPEKHKKAIAKVNSISDRLGFNTAGIIPSCLKGAKGNQEFFIYLQKP